MLSFIATILSIVISVFRIVKYISTNKLNYKKNNWHYNVFMVKYKRLES